MFLQQRLHTATLDGIKFYVSKSSTTGGRRQAIYEYIGTDRRQSQDLGKFRRKFEVKGLIVNQANSNYIRNRDNLLTALEAKKVHKLVHPWYGNVNIVTGVYTLKESQDQLGWGEISFTATVVDNTEASPPLPVAGSGITPDSVSNKANIFNRDLGIGGASAFNITTAFKNSFLAGGDFFTNSMNALSDLASSSGLFDNISDAANFLININKNIDLTSAFLNNPIALFSSLIDTISGIGGLSGNLQQVLAALKRLNQFGSFKSTFSANTSEEDQGTFSMEALSPNIAVKSSPITVQDTEINSNLFSMGDTVQQASLSEQYRYSSQVDYQSVSELEFQENSLETQFQNVKERVPDAAYESFNELRTTAKLVFDQKRLTTAAVRSIALTATTPLSLLSYKLYESTDRADEIQSLNMLNDVINVNGTIEVLQDVDASS